MLRFPGVQLASDGDHEGLQVEKLLLGRVVLEEADRPIRDDLPRTQAMKSDEMTGFFFDRIVQVSRLPVRVVYRR